MPRSLLAVRALEFVQIKIERQTRHSFDSCRGPSVTAERPQGAIFLES